MVESELFGHEKGAFSGAEKIKNGYFESADRGTLFIDDIDNIPPHIQGKLFSAIEDKKIFRLGSTVPIDLDLGLYVQPILIYYRLQKRGGSGKTSTIASVS